MNVIDRLAQALLCAIIAAAPALAVGQEAFSVERGQALVTTAPMPFETVVVGDTAIVSASVVNERTLAVTGLAIGRTNVILLSGDGAVQADWEVRVEESDTLTEIFRGTDLRVVKCDPRCAERSAPSPAP